ncbi:Membrane-bound transcription factor site-2 protease [Nymphon striatum]|nr:Membrane-bound transcription factor site-2 protease [Nymphon striatum]
MEEEHGTTSIMSVSRSICPVTGMDAPVAVTRLTPVTSCVMQLRNVEVLSLEYLIAWCWTNSALMWKELIPLIYDAEGDYYGFHGKNSSIMESPWILLIVIGSIWIFISFTDMLLKSCMLQPYFIILEKLGITIKPGRFTFYTTTFNKFFCRVSMLWPKFFEIWFQLGAVLGMLAVLPALGFLSNIAKTKLFNTSPIQSTEDYPVVLAMVPGINLPMSQIIYILLTLLLCSVFHEIGHAIAAFKEGIGVKGCGLFVLGIIPAAFVDLPDIQLNSLSPFRKLKIFCAGVWHNFILTAVAAIFLHTIPMISTPFYSHNSGVYVTHINPHSSVGGIAGLEYGDIVTHINDCEVKNIGDWSSCLAYTAYGKQGFCVNRSSLVFAKAEPQIIGMNLHSYSCCPPEEQSSLCFITNFQQKETHCLKARAVSMNASGRCNKTTDCYNQHLNCIVPILNNYTTLIEVYRKDRDRVLFLGHPSELYKDCKFFYFFILFEFDSFQLSMSNYIPRLSIFPAQFPAMIETFLFYSYITAFSSGLAVMNLVPCFSLDGYHIIEATVEYILSSHKVRPTTRSLISFCITVAGTVVLVMNVVLAYYEIM